jgi:hypothetical protein
MTISRILVLAILCIFGSGFSQPFVCNADVVITFVDNGTDVLATFAGSIDLTGLEPQGSINSQATSAMSNGTTSEPGSIVFQPSSNTPARRYIARGDFRTSFSNRDNAEATVATSSSGGLFILSELNIGTVFTFQQGYTSDSQLSGSALYQGESLNSLGIAAGSYDWVLGNNTVTLNIVAVPEPTATVGILLFGIAVVNRRRKV